VDFQFDLTAETSFASLRDGTSVLIRPIQPDDEPAMVRFHQMLSEHSVAMRYFHYAGLHQRVAHERLQRVCTIDPAREMVLIAEPTDAAPGTIVAVGRMRRLEARDQAEVAIIVADAYQRRSIGSELLQRLARIARGDGLSTVVLTMLPGNLEMQGLCRRVGRLEFDHEEGVVHAFVDLSDPRLAPASEGATGTPRGREAPPS
jgi:acetyltransferase